MSLNTAPVTSKRNEPKDKKFSKIYICLITFHMAKFSRVLSKWSRGEYFELLDAVILHEMVYKYLNVILQYFQKMFSYSQHTNIHPAHPEFEEEED